MSRVYDNWERLVRATIRREDLRRSACRTPSDISLASSSRRSASDFSIIKEFNLNQILKYNYHLIADATENVHTLCGELEILKGQMMDFAKYYHDSDYLKELVNEIREIVDEAEDAVDSYLVQAAVQKSKPWIKKVIKDYPNKLGDVGEEIVKVSNKIKEINQEKIKSGYEVLQYQEIADLNRSEEPKEAPTVEEDHVAGFDGAAEKVSKLLTGEPQQFAAISIVGMLGVGKTTLAKKIFKDPNVDYEYMIRAFVHVSMKYEKREVFLKILGSFTHISEEVSKLSEEELQKHVHKQLEGKQYLIVLDDLWEKEDWDRLKHAFPNNKKRCRVLITTRNEKVAEHANPKKIGDDVNPNIYKLDFLPFEKSRELLRWKVFEGIDCPNELQEYEVQIVEKCDGLPLAIVVIAGIIWNNRDRVDWWKHVADSVKDYIARDQEQTTKVIELMYKHLPNYLKPCFIYLGVFRDNLEIPVWKLVRLWIAEGLIQQEGGFNLEDMAEQFLEELVYRNLLMVAQRRSNDKIKTCRMHVLLHEFCKIEGAVENLFQEIQKDNLSTFLSESPALDKNRCLCINNVNVLDYISGKFSGKRVRSFLTFSKEETIVEPHLVSSIPKTFKLLRVLESQSLIFTRYPSELSYLVLLKYIAISSTFSSLPPAMSSMLNLQTLIVNTTARRLEIRADIWNMPQLRHLHTNASASLSGSDPKSQKSMEEPSMGKNLQTLSTISPESCKKEIFALAPKIKKLGICGIVVKLFKVSGESSLFGSLCKLESLENLKLLNDDVTSTLHSLPSEKYFPKQLTKLTLSMTLLDWKEMSTLGKLEKLEVLKLKDKAFQGKLWQTEKGGFLRLKHLHIGRTDLVVWEASVDHFPKLRNLELNNCDKLKALPRGLADIPTLQMVVVHGTDSSAEQLVRDFTS